jgi:mannose-6-phosphate isomerase
MLYPFKFRPRFLDKIWGGRKLETVLGKPIPPNQFIGESWELYDFPPGAVDPAGGWLSPEVADGPLAGRTLHWLIGEFGQALHGGVPLLWPHGQFPILIKFLDARENLSVQVHPDRAYAASHPGCHLKAEAWYVIQSDPGAKVYMGLKPGASREQFADAIAAGAVEQLINAVPVKPGQCFYLPSGTLHALGGGVLVAEVQTPSDTTFRVFDFNRIDPATGKPRKLHVEEALACINFDRPSQPPQPRRHVGGSFSMVTRLASCPYFNLEKVRLAEGVEQPLGYDQPVVWIMLEGQARIKLDGLGDPFTFGKGDTVLLPAEMRNPIIKTQSDCAWLEVTFPTG